MFRLLESSGIRCVVAAPSKLLRPSGDRVKTDARDAQHLARLLRIDEITEVRVPSAEEETARDLVRSREDTRQDLMASRHRLSKLLLRHGFVYSDGQAWITKTGNSHARRLLVEAGWQHRREYRPGRMSVMNARWEKVPVDVRLRGQSGNQRLHQQWVAFTVRKKRPVIANVAVARQLAGWCWSLAVMDE